MTLTGASLWLFFLYFWIRFVKGPIYLYVRLSEKTQVQIMILFIAPINKARRARMTKLHTSSLPMLEILACVQVLLKLSSIAQSRGLYEDLPVGSHCLFPFLSSVNATNWCELILRWQSGRLLLWCARLCRLSWRHLSSTRSWAQGAHGAAGTPAPPAHPLPPWHPLGSVGSHRVKLEHTHTQKDKQGIKSSGTQRYLAIVWQW